MITGKQIRSLVKETKQAIEKRSERATLLSSELKVIKDFFNSAFALCSILGPESLKTSTSIMQDVSKISTIRKRNSIMEESIKYVRTARAEIRKNKVTPYKLERDIYLFLVNGGNVVDVKGYIVDKYFPSEEGS